jgi:hypothetical protein
LLASEGYRVVMFDGEKSRCRYRRDAEVAEIRRGKAEGGEKRL